MFVAHALGRNAYPWSAVVRCLYVVLALCVLVPGSAGYAQLPAARLHAIFPSGGRVGRTVDVRISGVDLDGVHQLRFGHPGIVARPKMQKLPFDEAETPIPNQFGVTIGPDVPVGLYEVRTEGLYGISNPRYFVVDNLPETVEREGNNTAELANPIEVNSVLHGQINGATDVDYFRLNPRAGQRILIDCQASRIDSRLDAMLVLLDKTGREIARSRDLVGRDAQIDFVATESGPYTIRLHDFLYRGSPDYYYRLCVHTRPHIDFVLPPVVELGQDSQHTLYGKNLPGGKLSGLKMQGQELEQVTVTISTPAQVGDLLSSGLPTPASASLVSRIPYRFEGANGQSNVIPLLTALYPPTQEQGENNSVETANLLTAPGIGSGRFSPAGDVDWWKFTAHKGEILRIEVVSHRLQTTADPQLFLYLIKQPDQKGPKLKLLTQADDTTTSVAGKDFYTGHRDPTLRFQVPQDGDYAIMLTDQNTITDPRRVYTLNIRHEEPDFRLIAISRNPVPKQDSNTERDAWQPLVRAGGTSTIDVAIERIDGFNEPVEVRVSGLVSGLRCRPIVIQPGSNQGTLVLEGAETVPQWIGEVTITGHSLVGTIRLTRQAQPATLIWSAKPYDRNSPGPRSRVMENMFVATTEREKLPFKVSVSEPSHWSMARAGKVRVPFQVYREDGFSGEITLTPSGLPQGVKSKNVTVKKNKNEGVIEIEIAENAPLGELSFHVVANAKAPYSRNPEAAQVAQNRKKRLDNIVMDITKSLEQARNVNNQEKQQMKKTLAQLAEAQTSHEQASVKSDKMLAAAVLAAAECDEARQALQEAMARVKETAQVAAQTMKLAEQAVAQRDEMAKNLEVINAKVAELKKAESQAVEKVAGQEKQLKSAQQAQKQAQKTAEEKTKQSAPKDIQFTVASSPARVRIEAIPVTLNLGEDSFIATAGEKFQLSFSIQRHHDHEAEITVTLQSAPTILTGDSPSVVITKDSDKGELILHVAEGASEGLHVLHLKVSTTFHDKKLEDTQEVVLRIVSK